MSVIVILILASLSLALAFLGGFIWAVRSGQYEDTFTPSMRVLAEEEGQREEDLDKLDYLDAGKDRDKRTETD
jgi:cbb3-type cytochrome oxidase maturation protein